MLACLTSIDLPADEIVVVVGAAGGESYGQQFQQWADDWREIAAKAEANLHTIGLDRGQGSDRDRLQQILATAGDDQQQRLWIVLIGHGTYTRGVAKFNLRGPDVSAAEFSEWLTQLPRPIVLINTASASGPFVNRLSGDDRVIVTATRSGTEQNFARFGKFFTRAIAAADADLDHDDEVSVLEAFLRGAADVRQFYEAENRLATEHPLIDDNGDGKGTPPTMFRSTRPVGEAEDGALLDGRIASRITLTPAGQRLELTAEELQARDEIERELQEIRMNRDRVDRDGYDRLIEPLMIRLARIYQAAEARSLEKGAGTNSAKHP